MIIAFDFDRVLFKTDKFKEFLDKEIDGFLKEYPEDGNYDPEEHAEKLNIEPQEIFNVLEEAERFLYDDVEHLEDIREDFKIVIVSRGDPYFQERKIEDSGILHHVDGFFIIEEGPKDKIEIDFLVDDWKKELERVEVPGFLMERPEGDLKSAIKRIREEFE